MGLLSSVSSSIQFIYSVNHIYGTRDIQNKGTDFTLGKLFLINIAKNFNVSKFV